MNVLVHWLHALGEFATTNPLPLGIALMLFAAGWWSALKGDDK